MDTDLDKVAVALGTEEPAHAVRYPLLRILVKFQDGSERLHYALNESTIRRTSKTLMADIKISDFLLKNFVGMVYPFLPRQARQLTTNLSAVLFYIRVLKRCKWQR